MSRVLLFITGTSSNVILKSRHCSDFILYGCSFVAKLGWKKKFFWKNIFVFFKIYIICWKKCFYMEKNICIGKYFYWKNLFYREKYKWKCKNYISHLKNIFLCRKCLQIKCKSFLNTYSFCKKKFWL